MRVARPSEKVVCLSAGFTSALPPAGRGEACAPYGDHTHPSILALGVPLGVVASNRVRDDAQSRIEREVRDIALAVEEAIESGEATPKARIERIAGHHTVEIAARGEAPVRVGSAIAGSALRASVSIPAGGAVTVFASASEAEHDSREAWTVVGLLALAALAVAAALALWQARRLSAPLEALAEGSAHLGRAGFTARQGGKGIPEVEALAAALERRAEQIVELLERERAYSSNVAHQLRSPLTALSMRLEELAASEAPATRAEAEAALEQADRLGRTIDHLLALARDGRIEDIRDVDVAALLRDRVRAWQPIYKRSHREIRLDEAGMDVIARVAPGAVEQALDVLFENALVHGRGVVTAGARAAPHHLAVSVADEGSGIGDEALGTIFQPRAGGGGLGLPLARTLTEGSGGRLLVASSRPTVFEIRLLPASRPHSRPDAHHPTAAG